jgi:peptide-methionine (S)-S-oxide reductase
MTTSTETAILGGGCFWCLDAVYRELPGILSSECGYAGGHVDNPSYEQVCDKKTGHAEVVRLTYDPVRIAFADILRVFFTIHDPTTPNRQGADVGPQYRSIIIATDAAQAETARAVMAEIAAEKLYPAPLVTELTGPVHFWPAEPVHQNYFNHHPWAGYCQVVIAPKLAKFRKTFAARIQEAS